MRTGLIVIIIIIITIKKVTLGHQFRPSITCAGLLDICARKLTTLHVAVKPPSHGNQINEWYVRLADPYSKLPVVEFCDRNFQYRSRV